MYRKISLTATLCLCHLNKPILRFSGASQFQKRLYAPLKFCTVGPLITGLFKIKHKQRNNFPDKPTCCENNNLNHLF